MKFQKILEDAQRTSQGLRHLHYKTLKGEVKRLAQAVKSDDMLASTAALRFAKLLEAELAEVACCWELCVWRLKSSVDELYSGSSAFFDSDAAPNILRSPVGPILLLEPLKKWLPIAAFADDLRQHRLLQMTAVVKIQKKFVKNVGVQPRPGFTNSELLERSALSSSLIHDLCSRLEAAGDALLSLGLASNPDKLEDEEACSICLNGQEDPARLLCGHRYCINCILPSILDSDDGGLDQVLMRCPLCRATGPEVPRALCLDGLVARLGRNLSPNIRTNLLLGHGDDAEQFTAVVLSSLARLAGAHFKKASQPDCPCCSWPLAADSDCHRHEDQASRASSPVHRIEVNA